MEVIKVRHCNQVITLRNPQLVDLANMLNIHVEGLHPRAKYLYLDFAITSSVMVLRIQRDVQENDVVISLELFTEILIDVAASIPIRDALLKHNILVGK